MRQARVPRQWLSWHYRSQDESLIAFSNRQYYDEQAVVLPVPAPRSRRTPDRDGSRHFTWCGSTAQFHRPGTGEAAAHQPGRGAGASSMRSRPLRRLAVGRFASIGVVTFNLQQRALIEGLLRDSRRPHRARHSRRRPEGLFVKNLENVQGDERDVILFSTALQRERQGELPLNFGPLNRAGGERRLNVAITRARRQVIVFSSFDPAELRAEETRRSGIKHLRAYLDLAAERNRRAGQRIPLRHRA